MAAAGGCAPWLSSERARQSGKQQQPNAGAILRPVCCGSVSNFNVNINTRGAVQQRSGASDAAGRKRVSSSSIDAHLQRNLGAREAAWELRAACDLGNR
jgi:hypothetical protein